MLLVKNLGTPDEKHSFEHGDVQVVTLGGISFSRAHISPRLALVRGREPLVGTKSCQGTHLAVVVSGHLHVRMDDGVELELGPGDAHVAGPGHDAWVVGNEPCVTIDFAGSLQNGARVASCPCGVSFHVETDNALDHLVAAVQEHARGSHDHDVTQEHILAELTSS